MQDIIELVKEVFAKRIPRIELLQDDNKSRKTLYYKIYEGILTGNLTTNEEMAALLYNDDNYNNSFRKLKSRFRERLYNTILFVQPRETSPKSHMHEIYYCYKHQVIAKLLFTIGAQKSGHSLMKKVMYKAEIFQLYDVMQQCALTLRRNSLLTGNQPEFDKYNKLFLSANEKLIAESRAEELYYNILINFSQSLSARPDLAKTAKSYLDEFSGLLAHNTFNINLYYYRLKIAYLQLIKDFKASANTCDQFEKYLLSSPLVYTKSLHANTLIVKLDCCLAMHEYDEGAECTEKALKLISEGNENWFILLELYFLLSFNTGNIAKALEIFLQATEHTRFESIQPQRREIWSIYGGYLSFVLHYKEEEYKDLLKQLTRQKPEFKFSRLINEIPIYVRDKKGLNVAVIILQILILLQNKNFEQISKRTDALYRYTYRNLNKDDAYRSHYFIKMLIAMEQSSFNYNETVRKAEKYLEKLKKENVQYSPTQTRMEIIPYEDLWAIIMELLKGK